MNFESISVVTKKNKHVILRMISPAEAGVLLEAIAEITETSPYVLSSAQDFKKIAVEDEVDWIKSYNENPRAVLIIAEYENKIIGILDFKCFKNSKSSHRGGLGISLHHSMRGEGLGELLFKKLFDEAKKIDDLLIIELSVMSENIQAYHLYKKVGFMDVGRKPMAYKQPDGSFNDDILMCLKI